MALRGVICLWVLLPFYAAIASGEKPNIIFIMADDLGYNDLSCMGQQHFETPHIDALAQGGMRFTQYYAGCTVCAPSRACFLTGFHTGHVFQRFNGNVQFREDPADVTIATVLNKAGYRTAMIGKSGLSCNSSDLELPNRKGFDHFFGYVAHAAAHRLYPKRLIRNGEIVTYQGNQGKEGDEYAGDEFLRESLDWIAQNKSEPFFLHLSLQQPHADLQVPNSYRQKFIGKFEERPFKGGHYRAEQNPKATFAGMINYLDESVGKIVAEIERQGLSDNTIVMFTSDNGPHYEGGHHPANFDSNGPLRGGKRDLYEGGIRVPFIASWPGKIAPGTTSDLVSAFWDFPATACELAGLKPLPKTDGISMVPTLLGRGSQKQHGSLYWEFYEQGGKQAVRAGDWKAIRLNVNQDRNGPLELYNLASDISESNNVADKNPKVVARMAQIMRDQHVPSLVVSFKPRVKNQKTKLGRRITTGRTLDRSNWKTLEVSSESKFNGKRVGNAFDGNVHTIWHTQWRNEKPNHPHHFVVDMGSTNTISAIRLLNRQDGNTNGGIREFEFYVSDKPNFQEPAFAGSLEQQIDEQRVELGKSVTGRYFKFKTKSSTDALPFAAIAEFNLEP